MKQFSRILLFISAFAGWSCYEVKGQCAIDFSQTDPGIYPDTLPDATAGLPYSTDVTFVMLTDTLGLTIYNYEIASVVGLPVGLTWQCNNFSNGCNYDPSVSVYGCVGLTGTPLVAGAYTMTVTVVADVQLVGLQTIPFTIPFMVQPGTVTNPGFSMVNSSGCDPLTVTFINNNPGQAAYLWDFGNGLQSNLENPPTQTYNNPGTYVISQTVTPNTTPLWFLTDITVTSIPNNYGGIVDDPDLYFYIYDPLGNQVYDSHPSIETFPPQSWGIPNLPLQNGNYTVHVWDEDGGLFGADDDLGAISFAGNGPSGSATGTVGGASGTLVVNYTIFQTPIVPLVATDTIYVYATPTVPVISASGAVTFCEGDSVLLSVSDSVNVIQWYESGIILPGITGTSLVISTSGNFSVTATSPDGCSNLSLPMLVTVNPLPANPTFIVNGNTFTANGVTGNLQWYYNGSAISGGNGTVLNASLNGTYVLCVTDVNGCENCSDSLVFVNSALSETPGGTATLFPNPSNGTFTIVFEDATQREIVIRDVVGREVIRNIFNGIKTEMRLPVTGVYVVEIYEDGKSYLRKIVIE